MATTLRATRALFSALRPLPKGPKTTTPQTTNPTIPKTILEVERKFRRLTIPTLTGLTTTNTTTTTKPTTTSTTTTNHPLFQSILPLPTRTIHDIYYDTPHRALCNAGAYVRRRNGAWEAKVRMGGDLVNSRFEELRGEKAVRGCVVETLRGINRGQGRDGAAMAADMGVGVRAGMEGGEEYFGLGVIADLVTTREAWLVDGEFKVVRDVADFGHEVGEVELEVELAGGGGMGEEEKAVIMEAMDCKVEAFMETYAWAWETGEAVGKLTAYFEMLEKRGDGA